MQDSLQPAVADAAHIAAQLDQLNHAPTIANVMRARRELKPLAKAFSKASIRVGCVSSFTFEPLAPYLELQGMRAGIDVEVFVAPFGQFENQLIDPNSVLSQSKPDVVLIAVRLQDVVPDLYDGFNGLSANDVAVRVEQWFARLETALVTFRHHSAARILIQNYDLPAVPALGIADLYATPSQRRTIFGANAQLFTLAQKIANVRLMDYESLVAASGRAGWSDHRTALYARIPIAPANYWKLCGFYVRHLRAVAGLSKKVLLLDADNTLWGGVVGDVGIDGIQLGHDYPGNAFVLFQKRVLDLHRRGVVLGIVSKNEPGAVEAVLKNHPDMVLRPEHISAVRVNWSDKAQNIREIAAELNLGIDSFVFLDDSTFECELIRQSLPELTCICLPSEPAELAGVIDALDCFDQLAVSEEDRQRGSLYRAESQRRTLSTAAVDMPSFYRQLEMKLRIAINAPPQIGRAAQMSARTNQFNMNTIRLTEDDIRRWMDDPQYEVITVALADRFGDSGVIGMAVVKKEKTIWTLPMLLMSCRILGRTVEQGFIKWIAGRASAAGATTLAAHFVPTTKNKSFAGFYASCGFSKQDDGPQGEVWTLSLAAADTQLPDWLETSVEGASEHAHE